MNHRFVRAAQKCRDERGSGGGFSLIVLLFVITLFLVFGLVVDGGVKASAIDRANRIAMEGARAGAQSLTAGQSGVPVEAVVQQYLAAEGVGGSATITGDRVDVEVRFTEPTKVLGVIGYNSISVTGNGFALAIYDTGPGATP